MLMLTLEDLVEDTDTLIIVDLQEIVPFITPIDLSQVFIHDLQKNRAVFHLWMVSAGLNHLEQFYI